MKNSIWLEKIKKYKPQKAAANSVCFFLILVFFAMDFMKMQGEAHFQIQL